MFLLMTQKFSSFGNSGIADLQDKLSKEDIHGDPLVPFPSHTENGEVIPIKIRRHMEKIMKTGPCVNWCGLFKLRRISLVTDVLLSSAKALRFPVSLLFC